VHHDDPWIFEMVWAIEHREQPGRRSTARLDPHMAGSRQPAGSPAAAELRRWQHPGRLLAGLTAGARLRLRRSPAKLS